MTVFLLTVTLLFVTQVVEHFFVLTPALLGCVVLAQLELHSKQTTEQLKL
jgi:hypothetical protein